MVIVNANPLAYATHTAFIAVVDFLAVAVIVKAANGAKVRRKLGSTGRAVPANRLLFRTARSAADTFRRVTINGMIFRFIMAPSARIILSATGSLESAFPFMKLATCGALTRKLPALQVFYWR
jgi:hypothetical protein